jgi:hypothetical protein
LTISLVGAVVASRGISETWTQRHRDISLLARGFALFGTSQKKT